MQPIPQAIETLIQRCEANEIRFDNDDMSTALTYARVLRLENEELKASIRAAWLNAASFRQTTEEFAHACGVDRPRLIEWVSDGYKQKQE